MTHATKCRVLRLRRRGAFKEVIRIASVMTRVKKFIDIHKSIRAKRRELTTGEILDNILQYINMMNDNAEETLDEISELKAYILMIRQAVDKSSQILVPILSDEILKKYAKSAKKLVASDENAQ